MVSGLRLLLLVGCGLGELMQKFGQPADTGQLLGGLSLGPSMLALIWPEVQHGLFPQTAEQQSMINGVSQLGILMVLLLTGMETDLRLVRRVGKAAITAAAAGVGIAFVCDFALGEMLPDSILPDPQARTALFLPPRSRSPHRRHGGARNEVHAPGHRSDRCRVRHPGGVRRVDYYHHLLRSSVSGTVDLRSVSFAVLGTLLFLGVSFTTGRRVVFGLMRWTNDHFDQRIRGLTVILLIMIAMALTTYTAGARLGDRVEGVHYTSASRNPMSRSSAVWSASNAAEAPP